MIEQRFLSLIDLPDLEYNLKVAENINQSPMSDNENEVVMRSSKT
jgi:hypothetical protein